MNYSIFKTLPQLSLLLVMMIIPLVGISQVDGDDTDVQVDDHPIQIIQVPVVYPQMLEISMEDCELVIHDVRDTLDTPVMFKVSFYDQDCVLRLQGLIYGYVGETHRMRIRGLSEGEWILSVNYSPLFPERVQYVELSNSCRDEQRRN